MLDLLRIKHNITLIIQSLLNPHKEQLLPYPLKQKCISKHSPSKRSNIKQERFYVHEPLTEAGLPALDIFRWSQDGKGLP